MHDFNAILKAALLASTALLSTAGVAEDGERNPNSALWLKEYTPGTSPYTPTAKPKAGSTEGAGAELGSAPTDDHQRAAAEQPKPGGDRQRNELHDAGHVPSSDHDR